MSFLSYGLPLNGYITTNPLAPQSQQPFFDAYEDAGYEDNTAANAAAANKRAPTPKIVEEEPAPEVVSKAVTPAGKPIKDRRKGLTFWSLIV